MKRHMRQTRHVRGRGKFVVVNNDQAQKLLTTHEAADILGVHQRTVQRWIKTGKLTAIKAGPKLWRIKKEDLDGFISFYNSEERS